MPVPLPIFGCYTTYFRNSSDVIKADPVHMPFIEKASESMAVGCNAHIIVVFSSICYLDPWYLVLSILSSSLYSHRILGAARGSSQTSKI